MADNSYKPIEEIKINDYVATLEGAKRVNKVFPVRNDYAVKVDCFNGDGEIIYSQIQSCEHQLLTSEGDWDSYDTLCLRDVFVFFLSILNHGDELSFEQLQQTYQSFLQHLAKIPQYPWHTIKQLQLLLDHQYLLAIYAGEVLLNDQTDFLKFECQLLKDEQHFLKIGLQEHLLPFAQSDILMSFLRSFYHDKTYVHEKSLFEDFQGNYLGDSHQCDEPPHEYIDQYAVQGVVQSCPQQLIDVGQHNPKHFEDGGQGKVQKYNRQKQEYVHPYKKGVRQSQVDTISCSIKYTPVGIVQLYDIEVDEVNHYISGTQGLINKNCFDEITHFTRSQFIYITTWTRSVDENQRCRVICTGNPPTSAEGDWVIDFWGPWLDERHPNPAAPGELRWFTNIDGQEIEVPCGETFEHKGEIIKPKSRTFIPASIDDNPYLRDSGYKATLQSLPRELREKFLEGKFTSSREDNPWQVIPSEWVVLAQKRWEQRQRPDRPLDAIGADIARGGNDQTILSPRFGNYFDEQLIYPGTATPDGPQAASYIISLLSQYGNHNTKLNIDVIGVGSSVYDYCYTVAKLNAYPLNSAETSDNLDRTGQLSFFNNRAEWWWRLREALDPETGDEIALPPDRELLADLTASRWELTTRGIKIERKDDIKKRIGRSPDKGDSIVYALAQPTGQIAYGTF